MFDRSMVICEGKRSAALRFAWVRYASLLVFAACFFTNGIAQAQVALTRPADSAAQSALQERLLRFKGSAADGKLHLVRIDMMAMTSKSISVTLPNGKVIVADRSNEKGDLWQGENRESDTGGITLVRLTGDVIRGHFWYKNTKYEIQHVNGEHYVVYEKVKPRTSKLLENDVVPATPVKPEPRSSSPTSSSLNFEGDNGSIDLLVTYTADVTGNMANVNAEVEYRVALLNSALQYSAADFRVRLVGTRLVSYPPSGNSEKDLLAMGTHPQTTSLRNELGADVVIMLTTNPDKCGLARGGPVHESQAFALVNEYGYCRDLDYVFAHEFAHILAADHDQNNAPSLALPARGYYINNGQHCHPTIMVPPTNMLCSGFIVSQANLFSNPRLTAYAGIPQGAANADNIRVMNSRHSTVSRFRPAGPTGSPGSLAGKASLLNQYILGTD